MDGRLGCQKGVVTRRAQVLLVTLTLLATLLEWSLVASPASALKCGVWRLPVKTLSDQAASQVDYSPKTSSVRRLRRGDRCRDRCYRF